MLGTEPGFSKKSPNVLDLWAISLAPLSKDILSETGILKTKNTVYFGVGALTPAKGPRFVQHRFSYQRHVNLIQMQAAF